MVNDRGGLYLCLEVPEPLLVDVRGGTLGPVLQTHKSGVRSANTHHQAHPLRPTQIDQVVLG